MRYVVIGAGAVGGTIGARLHQAGHEVVLVARGEHLSTMQRDGLRLVAPDTDQVLEVPAVAGPDEVALRSDDVLVVATKSQHTAEALGPWASSEVTSGESAGRPAAEVLPLLCAQNGVANEPAALRWFSRVVGMCVWLPAGLPQPGTVVAPCGPLTGMLHLGPYPAADPPPGLDATLAAVAADLESSFFLAPRPPEVMAWKRAKLISNLGNAFDALFEPQSGWVELLERAQEEARAVFAAAGRSVTSAEAEARVRGDLMKPQEIPGQERSGGSTYQSLARGADSVETDYLNGEISAQGRRHDVRTPVNTAVQHLAARAVHARVPARSLPLDALHALL